MSTKSVFKLQTSITTLVAGLVIFIIVALGLSSHYFARDSANQLRDRILEDTAVNVYDEMLDLLGIPMKQNAYDRDLIERGALAAEDFKTLAISWQRTMASQPELAFLAIALNNGERMQMVHDPVDGHTYVLERRLNPQTTVLNLKIYKAVDYPDKPQMSLPGGLASEFKQDPWVRAAERAGQGQQTWTEVYDFPADDGKASIPGVACVSPIYKNGVRIGELTGGINVKVLCSHMAGLKAGREGIVFLSELHDHKAPTVIAHPSYDMIWKPDTADFRVGQPIRAATEKITDARVRSFMATLPPVIDRSDDAVFTQNRFKADGGTFVGGYQYIRGSHTPEWIVCTLIPEGEIMGDVWKNDETMVGVGLAVLIIGLLIGIALAHQISRPLVAIAEETKLVGQLNIEPKPVIRSTVQEVNDLGESIEEAKRNLRSFSKYVPTDLVRRLVKNKVEAVLGGENRKLTIFFSDIVDFTHISERMTPQALVEHLQEYLGAMSTQVLDTHGTVDKYIGDAIMAFWGAPEPLENHALSACTAALRCKKMLLEMRAKWTVAGKPAFAARIGLNTGEVIVGNIGSKTRMNYTVIGDVVNAASRLEGLNKYYGSEIMISEGTFKDVQGKVVVRPLDWVLVKGKSLPLQIFELLGMVGDTSKDAEDLAKLHTEGMTKYRQQDWDGAIAAFNSVGALKPNDGPSQKMIARCDYLKANPPGADWDGVYRHTEK